MAERILRTGTRVEIKEKGVKGTVQYIGLTSFAAGKWVGVVLDEPKGKNNGTIKGTQYFSCQDSYGMFVRDTQCIFLDDSDNPILDSPDEKPRSRLSTSGSSRSLLSLSGSNPVAKPTASRLSLTGSRTSLSGSRTQLAQPMAISSEKQDAIKTTRTSMSPADSVSTSKRASFVETGFLETLKPQFTLGQSLISPSVVPTSEDKLHISQLTQENDDLKKQVQDLNEKLETLKMRRSEDKERMREFDKMKNQFDQLQEFKSKIMEAQSSLQRELQRAKQEAKDAIEARDQHQEEMAELTENVELITLDKEMAEEKADTLQLELENAKERIEELTLDLEILKTEMQDRSTIKTEGSAGGESGGVSVYEMKQLEQQNTRLRETLVRMRDLSAHEKHEIQKLQKELEMKKSEVQELQRTKEKLSSRVDELEAQIVELQEEVDAALGAEEMVEQLGEKKMELEERVKQLEEEVAELEALEEVHEQLVESNHELELDLREELDMATAAKREALREKDAALETVHDRDTTILKFRELVQRLNDQIQELRDKVNRESRMAESDHKITETIDFKQIFTDAKAHTRAIDLQLRQIELTEVNEHIKYLLSFMPETFMARGGDHDAILVILLVSRIVFKAGIIVTQVRDRYGPVSLIDRNATMQGHAVHQFAFRSRLLYFIHNLQQVMHQFLFGLSSCTPEVLLKIGSSLPEMFAQEKIIDAIIDLLKQNQLDENSSTDNLEKCVSFFNAIYSVLLASEGLTNETQMVRDCIAALFMGCDSIETSSAMIRALIQGGDETSESGLLLQFVIQTCDNIRQQLKLIKRRLPQDVAVTKCNLSMNTLQNLKTTVDNYSKLLTLMHLTSKHVIAYITSDAVDATSVVAISNAKLWELLSQLCERVYEQDDRGISQNVKTLLTNANTDMSQLAQYLLDHEYEIMSAAQNEKKQAPIAVRAHTVKKHLEETKTLTATLENRDAEIRQLKMSLKMKQNELSEMQIRKDLAEKKLSVLQLDHESNSTKLQKELEEALLKIERQEKEYEKTMDHLQSDIDSLEHERGALREKLKVYSSKRGDLKTTTALDISASSPYIAQELSLLQKALKSEREERMKIQAQDYEKILKNLKPLHVPKLRDPKLEALDDELRKVKYDMIMSLVKSSEIPTTKTKYGNFTKIVQDHKNRQQKIRNQINAKVEHVVGEIVQEYLDRKPYNAVTTTGFAKFPKGDAIKEFQG
ncbi:dynactin subunit 1 isoform X3 [Chironomus tepperi]|uniref:dynactin subunit 1 isoform X3 n=1 Tax=Chironomus tepperi TaxID=113505 RepID=UPI00391FAE98